MIKKSFIVVLLVSVLQANAFAQETVEYEVRIAGIKIGDMVATKISNGNHATIEVESKVSFWFFGKINLDFQTIAEYKNSQFIRSEVNSKTNKGDFKTTIDWKNDQYDIKANNYKFELDTTVNRPIYFSSVAFYFEEPNGINEMFAESYGLISAIVKNKDYYEVNVNGNKNRFYYKDGVLDRAVMEFPIKNYVVKRKEVSVP